MIPEKTVGKLRQGWGSICFLLAPWWKYGKTLMVGSFISSVLFVPAAGYFSATLAQAVIEMIEAGKPFEAAFLTGLTYLLLALALNLLHAVYEDFYLRQLVAVEAISTATSWRWRNSPRSRRRRCKISSRF